MRRPAYAAAAMAHRQAGKPIEALVVALHDWQAGVELAESAPNILRIVVPADVPLVDLDWSLALACDVVLMGGEEADFYAAARLLRAAGAASVWGEFDDGFVLLDEWPHAPYSIAASAALTEQNALLKAIRNERDASLMTARGIYAEPLFREARLALFGRTFGPGVEAALRERAAA